MAPPRELITINSACIHVSEVTGVLSLYFGGFWACFFQDLLSILQECNDKVQHLEFIFALHPYIT